MTVALPRMDLLLSATLYLLARYADADDDGERARAALHHLRCLASHPQVEPMVRRTCAQLADKLATRFAADDDARAGAWSVRALH